MLRQFIDGWRFIGQTPLVRGLVLGIFGAFAGGGVVIGTAQFFAQSLGGGDAAFYLLFAFLFVGLWRSASALGPTIIRELSRRRWFGMSIVLAAASGDRAGRSPSTCRWRSSARSWSASAPAWRSWPAPRCSAARSPTRCAAGCSRSCRPAPGSC